MAMIGIAQFQRPLGHTVEARNDRIRLKIKRSQRSLHTGFQRGDICSIVMIRRQNADRGLPAHCFDRIKNGIMHAGCRCSAILRIERRYQNPVTTGILHRLQPADDAWIAVSHRPVNMDHIAIFPCQSLCLTPRIYGKRRAFIQPHLSISMGRFFGPGVQYDPAQYRLPDHIGYFHDALVRKKFLQIAFHRLFIG